MKAKYYKEVMPVPAVVERQSSKFPFDDEASAGDHERIPLPQYFASLRRHWLKIAVCCAGCLRSEEHTSELQSQ